MILSKPQTLSDNSRERWDDKQYNLESELSWFHGTLTQIHSFLDGNGRWARELTNLVLEAMEPKLAIDWSQLNTENGRKKYINALRAFDQRDHKPLSSFLTESIIG